MGKTRFALELCRGADWSGAVIYIRQAQDVRLSELVDSATRDKEIRLTIVADEVQQYQLAPLRDSIERGNGKIRLVTVGHCRTPDPARIPMLEMQPISKEKLSLIVQGWYPSLPLEHVDFVVNFCRRLCAFSKAGRICYCK